MRWISTIFAALSLVLFALAVFFWVRSYSQFDGVLHYGESTPAVATGLAGSSGVTAEIEVPGHSTGLISYRGQLTWVSIVNPVQADGWEGWSVPVDRPFAKGPMNIVWDVRERTGMGVGSAKTHSGLRDPIMGITWQLPYRFATLPYWVLAILLGILPVRWFLNYRQIVRREREGRCLNCGRDLKGVTTGNCPGCGAAIETASA